MSNARYLAGKEGILDGSINLNTGVIKAVLVRGYAPTIGSSTDRYVSDVTAAGGELVGTPQTLGSKTFTNGVFDAADVTFPSVTAGSACTRLLIYQASANTGGADVASNAQRLIALIDTATNLPVTPAGTDIPVAWDNGANKIFAA